MYSGEEAVGELRIQTRGKDKSPAATSGARSGGATTLPSTTTRMNEVK